MICTGHQGNLPRGRTRSRLWGHRDVQVYWRSVGDLRRRVEGERGNRQLKADLIPVVYEVGDVHAAQPGSQVVAWSCAISGEHTVLVATNVCDAIRGTAHAWHCDRSRGDIVEDARASNRPGGIATCSRLCRQWIQDVVRIALTGLCLLVDHPHDSRKRRGGPRRAADWNKVGCTASTSSIDVGFADYVETPVEAARGKQRDIRNISFAVIRDARACLPRWLHITPRASRNRLTSRGRAIARTAASADGRQKRWPKMAGAVIASAL